MPSVWSTFTLITERQQQREGDTMQDTQGITTIPQNTKSFTTERGRAIAEALEPYRAGLPAELVELTERQVFPYLIPASLRTGRDSRRTGELLGRQAPCYVKRGRSVHYRLKDVLNWLADGDTYSSTAEARSTGGNV